MPDLPASPEGPPFGHRCGFAGVDPEPRTQIEALIAQNDTSEIFNWLQRKDLVYRVYAAEALIRLEKNGMIIPAAELALVETLKNSTQEVYVCSGCSHWFAEIRAALRPSSSINLIRD